MPFFEYSSVISLQDCKRTQWTQLKFLRPDFGKSMMLFHKVSIFQCVAAKNSLQSTFLRRALSYSSVARFFKISYQIRKRTDLRIEQSWGWAKKSSKNTVAVGDLGKTFKNLKNFISSQGNRIHLGFMSGREVNELEFRIIREPFLWKHWVLTTCYE